MTEVYTDIVCSTKATPEWISSSLKRCTSPGEFRLSPIDEKTFDLWAQSNSDYQYPIQYYNKTLVVSIMLPPQDGASEITIFQIARAVDRVCSPAEPRISIHSGLTNMENGVRKNGDAHLYSHEGGGIKFPGIVCEVGYSDPLNKTQRDIGLWLGLFCIIFQIALLTVQVKCGIVCKIAIDRRTTKITKLLFEIWVFDSTMTSRATPLGRTRCDVVMDFSAYDGTAQTLPPQTVYTFPSYYVFSDGVYPTDYPPHPNPPPPTPQITTAMNKGYQFPLGGRDLAIANREIELKNNQKQPIAVDLRRIVDLIREVKW